MELIVRLDEWFDKSLARLTCSRDARAYIAGVLAKYKRVEDDMSRTSIVMSFAQARESGRFDDFQRIGDWVLFVSSVHPRSLQGHAQVTHDIGAQAYVACSRIMMGKWPVYDELSQRLPSLSREITSVLDNVR